jgi:hypothetical protein
LPQGERSGIADRNYIRLFKKNKDEDLFCVNDLYENRIPENYFAIAAVNYGDLLCLAPDGKVYHWDHETHDLYFDMDDKDAYLPQNINLNFVADSFESFLSSIAKYEIEDQGDDYDEFNLLEKT